MTRSFQRHQVNGHCRNVINWIIQQRPFGIKLEQNPTLIKEYSSIYEVEGKRHRLIVWKNCRDTPRDAVSTSFYDNRRC